jgi:hypothetical protein
MKTQCYSPVRLLLAVCSSLLVLSCSSGQPTTPAKEGEPPDRKVAAKKQEALVSASGAPGDTAGAVSGNKPPAVVRADVKSIVENGTEVLRIVPVGVDPEGDAVTFVYEWTKNGEPVGTGDGIRGFKRGDRISVKITPYDGRLYGQQKVLNTQVRNTSPRVDVKGEPSFDGKVFTYRIKAEDPDGDKLTYALVEAPRGMTVNGETGAVTWPISDQKGVFPVKAKVSDGAGGETFFDFTVTVAEEKVSVQPKAN